MWEIETIDKMYHVIRVSANVDSLSYWVTSITILTSLFEALLFPVLISIVWIILYKFKYRINGSEFRLCMYATYGSILNLVLNTFPRHNRLSKGMFIFIFVFFMASLLGKNIPNIALSKIIGIYNFTDIIHSNIELFSNDWNCTYSSCSADFENDFALVSNSKSIQNSFNRNNVQNAYWDSTNSNNTLYAVRAKTNLSSCIFSINTVSSMALGNITDTFLHDCSNFTGSYSAHLDSTRSIGLDSFPRQLSLVTSIMDRCDIPMNMFLVTPNFSFDVKKLANWLINGGCRTYNFQRSCSILLTCDISIDWKQMQIFGNTPDEINIMDITTFNNSLDNLVDLFSQHVLFTDTNGKVFGDILSGSMVDNMTSVQTRWVNTIKYQGNQSNFNFLDEFDSILSRSLASAVQSFMNNVSVDVIKAKAMPALGIWIELSIFLSVSFLFCFISLFFFMLKNEQLLLPLSVLNLGILSNAIFKEGDGASTGGLPLNYDVKTSWPFVLTKDEELVPANLA
ncbi:15240_t:CDS:1 [Cetraspora pellucida]|uniref:15240_t:CDS:1 n=1 Tax=Cetraspora pellucida TaxID=1433469 RepID=A0A9N9C098_9GLOM|nr:15240_t:CDS:1 [Cetraspora pellucida]